MDFLSLFAVIATLSIVAYCVNLWNEDRKIQIALKNPNPATLNFAELDPVFSPAEHVEPVPVTRPVQSWKAMGDFPLKAEFENAVAKHGKESSQAKLLLTRRVASVMIRLQDQKAASHEIKKAKEESQLSEAEFEVYFSPRLTTVFFCYIVLGGSRNLLKQRRRLKQSTKKLTKLQTQ